MEMDGQVDIAWEMDGQEKSQGGGGSGSASQGDTRSRREVIREVGDQGDGRSGREAAIEDS